MADFQYHILVSRNHPLLSTEQQAIIRKTRLLVAGCGIGSVMAQLAVRVGFEQLILVDADTVELKNLNRQSYVFQDLGDLKVEALARQLKAINPECSLKIIPEFVDAKNAQKLVSMTDIVIDAIDVLAPEASTLLQTMAKNQNKPVIFPFNLGWGGGIIVLTPRSPSFSDLLGGLGYDKNLLQENMFDLMRRFMGNPPAYLTDSVANIKINEVARFPQPAPAVQQCSALTIVAAVKLALGIPLPESPRIITLDPWMALTP